MADKRISDLTGIVGDDLADGDLFEVVDVSDTSGTNAGAGGESSVDAGRVGGAGYFRCPRV